MSRRSAGLENVVADMLRGEGPYHIALPPSGWFEQAWFRRGAVLRLLIMPDRNGGPDIHVHLTDGEYERMRAAFPTIPVDDARGANNGT